MGCIIFDLDGTLIDSEPACNQALLDLLPELPDNLVDLIDRYRGKRLAEIFTDLEIRLGRRLPAEFEQTYRAHVASIFERELKPMPGAEEALTAIKVPMCIASSGPMTKIRHALDLTGLSRFFGQQVFSSYDVGFWKPDPRLFLYAAIKMGFAPDRCAVVEDSSAGIAAAVAAGMKPFHYLPNGVHSVAVGATAIRDLRELASVRL
jgi:HAD superfamily hydrolase (TIGR01509 family)